MVSLYRSLHTSPPRPCPYLSGNTECVVATELGGPDVETFYHNAVKTGFRRSHNFVYRPARPDCDACRPVRICVDGFSGSRSFNRVRRENRRLSAMIAAPEATTEQYGLFCRYQQERHPGGGMDRMSFTEYRAMLEDSPVSTFTAEFRDPEDELAAVILADALPDGLSAVYSFFDPKRTKQGLGTFMVLWLIDEARRRGLEYVYLGYWIPGCTKMEYKSRFRPLEVLGPRGWEVLESENDSTLREAV